LTSCQLSAPTASSSKEGVAFFAACEGVTSFSGEGTLAAFEEMTLLVGLEDFMGANSRFVFFMIEAPYSGVC
jgi:hypothetical protein